MIRLFLFYFSICINILLYMNLDFLPNSFINLLKILDFNKLYEIRVRTGYPLKVFYENKYINLSKRNLEDNDLICTATDIKEIINNITEFSVYAFNDRLKQGYITINGGVRIGISGECVFNDKKILTINNISSLNIRIPHMIANCSSEIFPYIINGNNILNTLIISPPFCGKTTILKDLALKINSVISSPVLIIDDRGEFFGLTGENIDVLSYADKQYAFNCGIRSLSPRIVITDELSCVEDWKYVQSAVNSGVKVVASCHADSVKNLKNKESFIYNLFDRYVVLSDLEIGKTKNVFGKDFNVIV